VKFLPFIPTKVLIAVRELQFVCSKRVDGTHVQHPMQQLSACVGDVCTQLQGLCNAAEQKQLLQMF
jgi:hypothetical protein